MEKSVLILYFSGRKMGNCAQISGAIAEHYKQTNVLIYQISAENFPACNNCDYECLKHGLTCPSMSNYQKEVMEAAIKSNLVYFIIPNFCGYPCANYFAFNERSVGFFNLDRQKMSDYMNVKKRFIIVSNSEGDNFRAAMQQQTNAEPELFYLKSGKYKKQSISGDLLDSDEAKADLEGFLDAYRL